MLKSAKRAFSARSYAGISVRFADFRGDWTRGPMDWRLPGMDPEFG